jgi:hypothetical protein
MNNLIFLNHMLLFEFDYKIKNSSLYEDYLAIYRFFPTPPGVEYFNPRNMIPLPRRYPHCHLHQ